MKVDSSIHSSTRHRLRLPVILALCACGLGLSQTSVLAGPVASAHADDAEAESRPVVVAVSGASAEPPRAWVIAAQVGGALTLPSLDFALEAGHRWRRFGVLVKADWNRWVNTQKPPMLTSGALNLGVGGDFLSFEGRMRTAIAAGPSILLFRTVLDEPGKVGLFFDCYPSSILWPVYRAMFLRFDPLSFHVVAPVLDSIPLVVFEYRTSLAVEWRPW